MPLSRLSGWKQSLLRIPFTPDQARIHSLDGLRAVSIALVMAGHVTKINMFPGGFGVTIFFVISGFPITHLLLKELDRTGVRWSRSCSGYACCRW